ncbi:MAG TPA: hypothetical protein DIT25_01815 [Candidatus Moranbacteria bacterium]|nr:hypothetical protein [Candidatus Moranbacteria bacterium]
MNKLLLFFALYLPFQLALNPMEGVDLASIRVLTLGLFFVWLAKGAKDKKIIIKNNLQTWLIGSFLFLNAFSIVAARNPDWSARKLLFLFSIFPIYFVASRLIDNEEKMEKMIKALLWSGAGAAMIGIAQFLMQFIFGLDRTYEIWANYAIVPFLGNTFSEAVLANPSWLVNISGKTYLRATSIFPDPHMLSFYLGLLIPLALGMFIAKKNKLFFGAAFLILLAADLLTFSRGGYLGLFAGVLVLLIMLWHKLEKRHKFAVFVMAGFMIAAFAIPSPVSQRLSSGFDPKEGSNAGRLAIWRQAVEVVKEHPLSGVGIGNFPLAIKSTAGYREPIYAHNTYLDIIVETGLLNGFVWVSILFLAVLEFWKRKRNIIFFMAGVSLVIFSAHSMVETAIYSPTVLTLLLIILSFANIKDEKAA